jgi:hypothetical protein
MVFGQYLVAIDRCYVLMVAASKVASDRQLSSVELTRFLVQLANTRVH